MNPPSIAKSNKLLAALPNEVFDRWAQMMEPVILPMGKVIYIPGGVMPYVYFPTTAIVSLICVTREGQAIEVAIIGNDGIVGVVAFMGGQSALDQATVQRAGVAYRLRTEIVDVEFQHTRVVRNLLLRYAQALMAQVEQTAVCYRVHKLDEQLCRWLLMCMDRMNGDEHILITQDLLATLLGVRRESVTEAALRLRDAGLIRYARGHIEVLDRAGLEDRVCECYDVVKGEYDRLLGRAHEPTLLVKGCCVQLGGKRPHKPKSLSAALG